MTRYYAITHVTFIRPDAGRVSSREFRPKRWPPEIRSFVSVLNRYRCTTATKCLLCILIGGRFFVWCFRFISSQCTPRYKRACSQNVLAVFKKWEKKMFKRFWTMEVRGERTLRNVWNQKRTVMRKLDDTRLNNI